MKKYYSDKFVNEVTGRSLAALRQDRQKGIGIPYFKMGRLVRYTLEDIEKFTESCRVEVKPL